METGRIERIISSCTEVFMEGATNHWDQEVLLGWRPLVFLLIEDGEIDLAESVSDNILPGPIKVLTAEKKLAVKGFDSGNDWQIMTEEEYRFNSS